MKRTPVVIGLLTSLMLAPAGLAAEFYIYPAKGQSSQQQEKDKYECNQWAVNQTGFNPMDPPTATAPPPQQQAKKGGLLKGAAGGALLGTAVGAIAGNTGEGAAIGAAAGGLFGTMRRRDQVAGEQQAQQNYESQQSAQYEQRRSQWAAAYKTCLQGRGYTVS